MRWSDHPGHPTTRPWAHYRSRGYLVPTRLHVAADYFGRDSHQIRECSLNRSHVVVQDGLLAAVIPLYSNTSPILFSDGATVGLIVLPTDPIADAQLSGLFAGHWSTRFA